MSATSPSGAGAPSKPKLAVGSTPYTLLLRVHSADKLRHGASKDAYCKVYIGKTPVTRGSNAMLSKLLVQPRDASAASDEHRSYYTAVSKASAAGTTEWNEKFEIPIQHIDEVLSIRAKCKQPLYCPSIGACAIQLSQVADGRTIDQSFPLLKGRKDVGTIRLQLRLVPTDQLGNSQQFAPVPWDQQQQQQQQWNAGSQGFAGQQQQQPPQPPPQEQHFGAYNPYTPFEARQSQQQQAYGAPQSTQWQNNAAQDVRDGSTSSFTSSSSETAPHQQSGFGPASSGSAFNQNQGPPNQGQWQQAPPAYGSDQPIRPSYTTPSTQQWQDPNANGAFQPRAGPYRTGSASPTSSASSASSSQPAALEPAARSSWSSADPAQAPDNRFQQQPYGRDPHVPGPYNASRPSQNQPPQYGAAGLPPTIPTQPFYADPATRGSTTRPDYGQPAPPPYQGGGSYGLQSRSSSGGSNGVHDPPQRGSWSGSDLDEPQQQRASYGSGVNGPASSTVNEYTFDSPGRGSWNKPNPEQQQPSWQAAPVQPPPEMIPSIPVVSNVSSANVTSSSQPTWRLSSSSQASSVGSTPSAAPHQPWAEQDVVRVKEPISPATFNPTPGVSSNQDTAAPKITENLIWDALPSDDSSSEDDDDDDEDDEEVMNKIQIARNNRQVSVSLTYLSAAHDQAEAVRTREASTSAADRPAGRTSSDSHAAFDQRYSAPSATPPAAYAPSNQSSNDVYASSNQFGQPAGSQYASSNQVAAPSGPAYAQSNQYAQPPPAYVPNNQIPAPDRRSGGYAPPAQTAAPSYYQPPSNQGYANAPSNQSQQPGRGYAPNLPVSMPSNQVETATITSMSVAELEVSGKSKAKSKKSKSSTKQMFKMATKFGKMMMTDDDDDDDSSNSDGCDDDDDENGDDNGDIASTIQDAATGWLSDKFQQASAKNAQKSSKQDSAPASSATSTPFYI